MPTKSGQVVFEDIVQGRTFWSVNGSARGEDGYIIPYMNKVFVLSKPMTYKRYRIESGRLVQSEHDTGLDHTYWVYVHTFYPLTAFTSIKDPIKDSVSLNDRGIVGPRGKRTNYNRNRWFVTEGAARSYMDRLRLTQATPKYDDDVGSLYQEPDLDLDFISRPLRSLRVRTPDHHVIAINTFA